MRLYFCITCSLVLCGTFTFGQETIWEFHKDDQAIIGLDIMTDQDENLYILGNESAFSPPYPSGIPSHGIQSHGSHFFKINGDWEIQYEKRFFTGGLISFPAHYFIKHNKYRKFYIPFVKRNFEAPNTLCWMNEYPNSYFIGASIVTEIDNDIKIDTVFLNKNTLCEYPVLKGFFEIDNNLLVVYSNYNADVENFPFADSLFFDIVDSSGTILSSNSHYYGERIIEGDNYYFPKNSITIDKERETLKMFNYLVSNDGIARQTVLETDFQGNVIRESLLFDLFGEVESGNRNDGFYYAKRDTILTKLDDEFRQIWKLELPFDEIEDFKVLASGEILVLLDHYQGVNRTSVGLVSKDGELISLKSYSGSERRPKKIVPVGSESFAVLGTKWIPFSESEIGNPYAKIFVLKDEISNLETYTNIEKVDLNERILVHPNPSSDFWNIWLPSNDGGITLYSALGKIVFKQSETNRKVIQVENSALQKGLYFLHWQNLITNQTLTTKLIKQ